jgi:hypothetical protein
MQRVQQDLAQERTTRAMEQRFSNTEAQQQKLKCSELLLAAESNGSSCINKLKFPGVAGRIRSRELAMQQLGLQILGMREPERCAARCELSNCFNWSRCSDPDSFSVFVYPEVPERPLSPHMRAVLAAIRRLPYVTIDPAEACILVPSVDTLDRDPLSVNFNPDAQEQLWSLPQWEGGRNHVLFVLFPGSYPYYLETLDLDPGQAMIAGSCHTTKTYRESFDLAIPHLNPSSDDLDKPLPLSLLALPLGAPRRYLATFKGKRYVYGVDSEARNQLRTLHNGRDVIMLTTCKHLNNWKKFAYESCEVDMERYDRFDYNDLMVNTTFSVCVRGRRVASYRFQETIAALAIPVVLADDFILPFPDAIDWSQVSVRILENATRSLVRLLRQIPQDKVARMQRAVHVLSTTVFRNIDTMMGTTFDVLFNRLFPIDMPVKGAARGPHTNTIEAAASGDGGDACDFAAVAVRALRGLDSERDSTPLAVSDSRYVAVILSGPGRFDALFGTLTGGLSLSKRLGRVVVVLNGFGSNASVVPDWEAWPRIGVPIEVYIMSDNSPSNRFVPWPSVLMYDAFLSLNDEANIPPGELEFGYSVWAHDRKRLVGWPWRSHRFDATTQTWFYHPLVEQSEGYSMVLTGASFAHTLYRWLYWSLSPFEALSHVDEVRDCEDILFNFITASVSQRSPVKIVSATREAELTGAAEKNGNQVDVRRRSKCLQRFVDGFGAMPLRSSILPVTVPSSAGHQRAAAPPTWCAVDRPKQQDRCSGQIVYNISWLYDVKRCEQAARDSNNRVRWLTSTDLDEQFTVVFNGQATRTDLLKAALRAYDGQPRIAEILVVWGPPGSPAPAPEELGVNRTAVTFLTHFPTNSLNNR